MAEYKIGGVNAWPPNVAGLTIARQMIAQQSVRGAERCDAGPQRHIYEPQEAVPPLHGEEAGCHATKGEKASAWSFAQADDEEYENQARGLWL